MFENSLNFIKEITERNKKNKKKIPFLDSRSLPFPERVSVTGPPPRLQTWDTRDSGRYGGCYRVRTYRTNAELGVPNSSTGIGPDYRETGL